MLKVGKGIEAGNQESPIRSSSTTLGRRRPLEPDPQNGGDQTRSAGEVEPVAEAALALAGERGGTAIGVGAGSFHAHLAQDGAGDQRWQCECKQQHHFLSQRHPTKARGNHGRGAVLRQASKSVLGGEFCLRPTSWRDTDGGRALWGEQLHPSAYVVRQIFAGGVSRYLLTMNAQPTQPELRDLAQHVGATASTPLARFAPSASAVPDQMVDQWVEQELRRGRGSVRAGLAMLAFLAGVAIPLVLWF
jgi:hypothetical protein